MGLNIKSEETHRLAARLAKLTGETMTGAVTTALRERIERVELMGDALQRLEQARILIRDSGGRELYRGCDDPYDDNGLPV